MSFDLHIYGYAGVDFNSNSLNSEALHHACLRLQNDGVTGILLTLIFALKNYLRTAGLERSIVVTDAIAPAALGPGRYTQGSIEVEVGEDMVARAPDSAGGAYLAGAAITMPQSIANLRTQIGLNARQIERITDENPRRAIGL